MSTLCIYTAPDHFSALSAKALLEENNIVTLFPSEYSSSIKPGSVFRGQYKLLVHEDYAQEAYELLKAQGYIESSDIFIDPIEQKEPSYNSCPLCNSQNIDIIERKKRISGIISFFLFNQEKSFIEYKCMCNQCNHSWTHP